MKDPLSEHAKMKLTLQDQAEQERIATQKKREEAIREGSYAMGEFAGLSYSGKLDNIAALIIIKKIKDTKQYRDMGFSAWAEFCDSFGVKSKTIDEKLMHLSTLGLEFLEASQKMGLTNRDLRRLEALPADVQADAINQTIDLENPSKEQVRDLLDKIEDQAADNALLKNKLATTEDKLAKKDAAIVRGQEQLTEAEKENQKLKEQQKMSLIRGDEEASLKVMTDAKMRFDTLLLQFNRVELKAASPKIKATLVALLAYMSRALRATTEDICQYYPEINVQCDAIDIPEFDNPWDNMHLKAKEKVC